MFIALFSPKPVPDQTSKATCEIRHSFRGEPFSSAFHELGAVFTVSPQQSPSGIFLSAALWLTILKGDVLSSARHSIHAHGRLQRDGEAAGGHCPHHRRLHQAEKSWGAELFRPLSVSWGEDAVVFSACHAPVLSLLRLRRFRGRVQLRPENRKHHLS